MMLKRESQSKPAGLHRWLRAAGASAAAAVGAAALMVGCLDRPVAKQTPQTNNVFVAEIRQTAVDKIDLLFMIDNSISMADKQVILGEAVPELMTRLVNPICVNADGTPGTGNANDNGECPANQSPEFSPIKDIHIGVVTSSLGAHGGKQTCLEPKDDDKGMLLGRVDPAFQYNTFTLPGGGASGFLAWDPNNKYGGERNATNLKTNFTNMVRSTGQTGCGYEASLESWYRFLIDPEPPVPGSVREEGGVTVVAADGTDANPIVAQRKQFLRPDSLVAIVMLTDENDCSIRDDSQGWLVGTTLLNGQPFRMYRSTDVCANNPNDPCCFSCGIPAGAEPKGCAPASASGSCQQNGGAYATAEDHVNLRCYEQKRRFGLDLLYPTSRYVNGLYEAQVPKRDGSMVANPLYVGSPPREKSLVFFAGIIGVPWQDVATRDSWQGNGLDYLTFTELTGDNRWNWILGAPGDAATAPGLPLDRLMLETPADRSVPAFTAPHPGGIANAQPQPPGSPNNANPINGHESVIADNSDLQYACTFPLPAPVNCADANIAACDCKDRDQVYGRSLCNGTTQNSAKAYPGVRHLQVLKDFGEKGTHNSIVASICPKSLNKANPASYGYNPAVSAIVERLKEALRGKCLPRKLTPIEAEGNRVPCSVVEAQFAEDGSCNCAGLPGRKPAGADISNAVYKNLRDSEYCDVTGQQACNKYCLCEIDQLPDATQPCKASATTPTNQYGYCYIDPEIADAAQANAETLVASCPSTQRRLLRFAGENVPAKGAIALIACLGSTNDANY